MSKILFTYLPLIEQKNLFVEFDQKKNKTIEGHNSYFIIQKYVKQLTDEKY